MKRAAKANERVEFQFSAGGIVIDGRKALLIRTRNLQGKRVWAFPKGHIEKGETAAVAARREVLEETGYSCAILKGAGTVRYFFRDKGRLVKKTVRWFLMKPLSDETVPLQDRKITRVRWSGFAAAEKLLSYELDRELLKKIRMGRRVDGLRPYGP